MSDMPLRTAHAGRLVAEALEAAFMPNIGVNIALWAEQNRWVEGAFPGRWDNRKAPYLREPMETIGSEDHLTTVLVGPGQCGKTAIAENALLAAIDADPGPILWYMQTDDAVTNYVKGTINPLIEAHPAILAKRGRRNSDDSLGFKRFGATTIEFLGATRSKLISKKGRRIVADEWDAYDEDFGDPKAQLDVRRQTYGDDSHLLAISHPDKAKGLEESQWTAGIMALYRDSDRRAWWWPCPECDAVSSPAPHAARVMRLVYPEGDDVPLDVIAREAALLCPCCGALIRDDQRHAMNREGFWARQCQDVAEDGTISGDVAPNTTAGFWIQGVMSPFLLEGIGGLARNRVMAERDAIASGDDAGLREVVVKQWGIPYSPTAEIGGVDATALAARADPGLKLGEVPAGVRFIDTVIDVQGNRFERMTRGWGEDGRSWIIDFVVTRADTAVSDAAWDEEIAAALDTTYPLADGSGRHMRVLCVGCDSGGQAGVTDRAYDAWLRARKTKKARLMGKFDGREGWNFLLLKGASGPNAQSIVVSYPESARKDRRAAARGQIPVGSFAPNLFKDRLAHQLAVGEADAPWYVNFPGELRSQSEPHLWFQQLVAEKRLKNGRWEKITASARNEGLDLMVMSHVMAHLFGIGRIDWTRPPAWAAEWDKNSMVFMPETVADRPAPARQPVLPRAETDIRSLVQKMFAGRAS